MLQNIIKSNHPFVIIFVILSAIALWFNSFIEPMGIPIPSDTMNTPFYGFIANNISFNSRVAVFITLILVLLQSLLLVQFNKKYILINNRTYLPAFFFILISGSFVQLQRLNPVVIGTLFIYWAINIIYGTYRTNYALNRLFLAGFLIAIASLFWTPLMVYIFILFISLTILRPLIGREWVVSILGFLTPYLFIFVYYFVFFDGNEINNLINIYTNTFHLLKEFDTLHYSYYIFYGYLLLLIILASYTIITNYQKKKIRARKFFQMNWWIFLIGILLFGLFKKVSYEVIYLIAFPTSFLLTDYFYSLRKSWFMNGILLILIGSIVYIQIIAV